MEQIALSLQQSFGHENFINYRDKLHGIATSENQIFINYDGPIEELLLLLAQVEFSVRWERLFSGPFIIQQHVEDQYELKLNLHYHLAKPLIPNIILQKIPSHLLRKITLNDIEEIKWNEKLEYAGVFNLYNKDNQTYEKLQEIQRFFVHFAKEVERVDHSKRAIESLEVSQNIPNGNLKVGYLVNNPKYVQLLKEVSKNQLDITHLTVPKINNLQFLSSLDCVIIPIFEERALEKVDILSTVFLNKMPLYESYRKMYYPEYFIRKGTDLFGYPNLKESFLVGK